MLSMSVLMKPASGMCNMSCDYCFYVDEQEKRTQKLFGMMSEDTLKNIIRKTILKVEKGISYAFQGGEPLLRGIDFYRKAIEFQKQYNKNHISVINAIQTNGLLLNEEWCSFFKENNFLVGVSVDGISSTHDAFRHTKCTPDTLSPLSSKSSASHESDSKHGTYEKIIKNIHLLDQYGVDYNILTVVHKQTAPEITAIYEDYKKKHWNFQQYILCMDPLNTGHENNLYALSPDEYATFLITLFDLWYADWKKGQQPYIRQFENYIGILTGYLPEACDQRGICQIQYVVEADGSVYPCDFYMLDDYYLGNFNQNRLEEMDQKRCDLRFVERSLKHDSSCDICPYYGICRGGCQRYRDYQASSDQYKHYFCKGYQMFFESRLNKLQEMANSISR